MTGRLLRMHVLLLAVCCLLSPFDVEAQQARTESDGDRKPGTYLKAGLAHWQGNIFSRSSLTHWNVDLFGAEYNLTSVNVEVETYFAHPLLVSGFSIGYRKDALRYIDSGHMLSGTLFRDIGFSLAALKVGGGLDWGMPSLNFDRTEFEFATDGTVRYRHTYPARNATLPFGSRTLHGSLYPFIEVSAVQRPSVFLIEAGMRVNIIGFHFDDYEVSAADEVTHAFSRSNVLVPYLFANVGLKLF